MLQLDGITCGYGRLSAIRNVDLEIEQGSAVALLGANGAGKTTTLRAAAGLLRPSSGRVILDGHDVTRVVAERRARMGIRLVPEGRQVFGDMTVRENLYVAGASRHRASVKEAIRYFPQLEPHLGRRAGQLSGGQQQMVALARALVSNPRYLLIDELSLGLAPLVVSELVNTLKEIRAQGITLLIVEQHIHVARELADFVVLLAKGSVLLSGPTESVVGDDGRLEQTYLGGEPSSTFASAVSRISDGRALAAAVSLALRGSDNDRRADVVPVSSNSLGPSGEVPG